MSGSTELYVRRLVLALDAGRCCVADVLAAVELAAIIGAELEGLFVEDRDLLDLARLPFAREVGSHSGQDRPLMREAMEALLRRRIERTAGALERAGRQRNVPVSYTRARGKVVQQALIQGHGRDVLLFNPYVAVPDGVSHRAPGPVMVWYEDRDAIGGALDIAVELARRLRSELHVGFAAEHFATERDVRTQLAVWLARLPGRIRVYPVRGTRTEALVAAARAARAAQLVLDANSRLATEEMLEHLLSTLGSRVILVR